jgi:hypothetical protein
MGYTTDFEGFLSFDKPLAKEHADYLRAFNETRRMKRNAKLAESLPDPIRVAAGLPIGDDGGYFVGSVGFRGQDRDASVIDYNTSPGHLDYGNKDFNDVWKENERLSKEGKAQPGLWCQWTASEDNTKLEWDGGEKFYNYIEWLKYIIDNFTKPWGYILNGEISWVGEDSESDTGKIIVVNNEVSTVNG